jgi:hypothetical protein
MQHERSKNDASISGENLDNQREFPAIQERFPKSYWKIVCRAKGDVLGILSRIAFKAITRGSKSDQRLFRDGGVFAAAV